MAERVGPRLGDSLLQIGGKVTLRHGEMSRVTPRAHAHLPRRFVRLPPGVKPLGSRNKIRLSLSSTLRRNGSRTGPTPKTFGQGQTYGGSG